MKRSGLDEPDAEDWLRGEWVNGAIAVFDKNNALLRPSLVRPGPPPGELIDVGPPLGTVWIFDGDGWRLERSLWDADDLFRELEVFSPAEKPATKPTVPLPDLIAEMRRRAAAGEIRDRWDREAGALSEWADDQPALREKPHSRKGISGRPELKDEYRRLMRTRKP